MQHFAARSADRRGLTALELLIAISVIGLLAAITLPAVQSSREAARRVQCRNHLMQIGRAVHNFETVHGHFPSNGWGFLWVGDPDRGAGPRQPGGWIYQLLPYVEGEPIAKIGAELSGFEKLDALAEMLESPLPVFKCPTRPSERRSLARPQYPRNATWAPYVAKTDYAINEGDYITDTREGPRTLAAGDHPAYEWTDVSQATGISFLRSQVRMSDVRDGLSNTFLAGEKYVRSDAYNSAEDLGHDQTMYTGVDLDINRWTIDPPLKDSESDANRRFGSAHQSGCHFVLCDGSVRQIADEIDAELYRSLGNRKDGEPMGGF